MISVLWTIFSSLITAVQSSAIIWFMYSFFGTKKNKKNTILFNLLFAVSLAFAIELFSYVSVFYILSMMILLLIINIYSAITLKGSLLNHFLTSILCLMTYSICDTLIYSLFSVVISNFTEKQTSVSIYQMVYMITCQLLSVLLFKVYLIFSKNRKNINLNRIEWALILITLFINTSSILCLLHLLKSIAFTNHADKIIIIILIMAFILVSIFTYYMVIRLSKSYKISKENEILKFRNAYQLKYMQSARQQHDAIRKIKHDIKNNYMVLYALMSEGKTQNAMQYLEKNLDIITKLSTFVNTESEVLNAIINSKLSSAKNFGIDVSCISTSSFNGIEDNDLCNLLGNMMDNAITACRESSKDNKSIHINISNTDNIYIFIVKNTADDNVLSKNPNLKTTKNDSENHGYGTKIISRISKKYNGSCDYYYEDGLFCCSVLLNGK